MHENKRSVLFDSEGSLHDAIRASLRDEIKNDIAEGRVDSIDRLYRHWSSLCGSEMNRIEKAGSGFIVLGGLASVFAFFMMGFLGKWGAGFLLGGIMVAAIMMAHYRFSRRAMRVSHGLHVVNEALLGHVESVEPVEGDDPRVLRYLLAQKKFAPAQHDAVAAFRASPPEPPIETS